MIKIGVPISTVHPVCFVCILIFRIVLLSGTSYFVGLSLEGWPCPFGAMASLCNLILAPHLPVPSIKSFPE